MTTSPTDDRADAELRGLLAEADPARASDDPVPPELLASVYARIAEPSHEEADAVAPVAGTTSKSYPRRHWQGLLWAAASLVTIALAAGTLMPGLLGATSDADMSTAVAGGSAVMEGSSGTSDSSGAQAPVAAPDAAPKASDSATGTPALARSAAVLVGTDDIDGARDRFVAEVAAMGGRVMAESVVTEDGGGVTPAIGSADTTVSSDMAIYPNPYPWYPSGPGVWLSVEVPVAEYDRAVAAAQAAGQVVRLEQSTTDVTAQKADVEARVAALEASLTRLTALLGQAGNISDVVALEEAIATRQAELDSLRSQQAQLASQTEMSRVSLTLMSPGDATASIAPDSPTTWWDSFLAGLTNMWAWLGTALFIVSPLLIAGVIVLWVRRRQRHRSRMAPPQAEHGDPA